MAVGLLKLVEQGVLSLEQKLSQWLDMPETLSDEITIRHLLTHTSGLPDYFDEAVMNNYAELWQDFPNYNIRHSRDLLPLFMHKPMQASPGERFHYNNAGFVLLGLVVEAATGLDFDMYLKEQIFTTCNLSRTGYYELDCLPEGCATAYFYDTERQTLRSNIFCVDVKGTGAGGAFTTIGDLTNLWKALLQGHLLNKRLTADLLTPQIRCHLNTYYSYGLWLKNTEEWGLQAYIQGQDPGVSCLSGYNLTTDLEITLLSNQGQDVWSIEKAIRHSLES